MRARLMAIRARFERSWAGEVVRRLKEVEFGIWITMFGAALLWSAVPLIILLSSLADERVDDDLSRHIGLSPQGARIMHTLFRGTPAHALEPIVTGFVFSFAGVVAAVSSLQVIYERVFGLEQRGWANGWRWVVWTLVVLAALTLEGAVTGPIEHGAGPVVLAVLGLVLTTLFFWWTLHFLLAGRASWRGLARPAVATGGLWVAFTIFSSFYFSPILISDSHTYGTIGVVFTLLTWFFLIGAVIVLGAVIGASWQARAGE